MSKRIVVTATKGGNAAIVLRQIACKGGSDSVPRSFGNWWGPYCYGTIAGQPVQLVIGDSCDDAAFSFIDEDRKKPMRATGPRSAEIGTNVDEKRAASLANQIAAAIAKGTFGENAGTARRRRGSRGSSGGGAYLAIMG